MQVLLVMAQKAGEAAGSPLSVFQQGGFPLGSEKCWTAGWDEAGKMKLPSLPFLCGYSQVLLLLLLYSVVEVS